MSMPPPPPQSGSPYQSPYGGGVPQPHPRGTTVLVLGILSLFCFGIILGPIAIALGKSALNEIDANPAAYSNRGMVLAGFVLGIVGLIGSILLILVQFS
jgi:hypothetical protein